MLQVWIFPLHIQKNNYILVISCKITTLIKFLPNFSSYCLKPTINFSNITMVILSQFQNLLQCPGTKVWDVYYYYIFFFGGFVQDHSIKARLRLVGKYSNRWRETGRGEEARESRPLIARKIIKNDSFVGQEVGWREKLMNHHLFLQFQN